MKLHYDKYGDSGPALLILHGLFGSARNWSSIARLLSEEGYQVYCLDQRNHGDSPHHPSHTLADLRGDVIQFIEDQQIQRPVLLGHSMGGMVAMSLALEHPEVLSDLVVVDIAPRSYEPRHSKEFAALQLDVGQFQSRKEIDEAMARIHPSPEVRRFLQMNLRRTKHGYEWKLNVEALENAAFTSRASFSGSYPPESLPGQKGGCFIVGEKSDYVLPEDYNVIRRHFPKAQIHAIAGAGHWLHHSHQGEFLEIIKNYL